MNILLAIDNEKIYEEIKKTKNINVIGKNIQYKEGILEILEKEKNKNIKHIIVSENLYGQIKIEKLIQKIKSINKSINIIMILDKTDLNKEEYLSKNRIKYIYNEKINKNNILDLISNNNKIIGILGNEGSGKTITTLLLSEIIIKYKNKKILIIEDNIKNNSIFNMFKLDKTKIENRIKNNLYLFSVKKVLNKYKKNKNKIINEINKIKHKYDYIFVDIQNIKGFEIYKEIIEENILLLNPNILEINKIKKIILKNEKPIKIILNNYNENAIDKEILKNIFKNKIEIIEKIENNKSYNLIINNNFNTNYLDKKTEKVFSKIIEKI